MPEKPQYAPNQHSDQELSSVIIYYIGPLWPFVCMQYSTVLSYLEFLVQNAVSVHMIKNHISGLSQLCMVSLMDHGNIQILNTL